MTRAFRYFALELKNLGKVLDIIRFGQDIFAICFQSLLSKSCSEDVCSRNDMAADKMLLVECDKSRMCLFTFFFKKVEVICAASVLEMAPPFSVRRHLSMRNSGSCHVFLTYDLLLQSSLSVSLEGKFISSS